MQEQDFSTHAAAAFALLTELLEDADTAGKLEVEEEGSTLTIMLPDGKQYVVSKHAPTHQLWLSSPVSGGLHFSFNAEQNVWSLPDGRGLAHVIQTELHPYLHD